MQPVLFISHGSPMMAIEDSPTHSFLKGLGAQLPRPDAIVILSAHHMATPTEITAGDVNETIYDFYNFPGELYALSYPAKGKPALAQRIKDALGASSVHANLNPARGLDHGAWIPLLLMYPDADIPVVQVSLPADLSPETIECVGAALAPLRDENILVIGSGGITHNLRTILRPTGNPEEREWAHGFTEWVASNVQGGDMEALAALSGAPHAAWNHPTLEHYYPLVAAMAAAGGAPGTRIHKHTAFNIFSLDAYGWGIDATS